MSDKHAIIEVSSDKSETPLLQFANGRIKKRVEASDLKMKCFYSDATHEGVRRKRLKKILVAENKKLQYTGFNFGPNAPKSAGVCRFYIGIHNKVNGTMRVLPSSLFHMKPQFNNDTDMEDTANISFREKRDNLTAAFGSKGKRRTIESRESNLVHEGTLQTSVNTIVQETKIEKSNSDLTSRDSTQPEAIPPRNEQATTPEEVYDLNSIILKEEYDALTEYAEELCSADVETIQTWKTENKFSNYLLSWLTRLQLVNKSERMNTAVLLLYFNHLVTLLSLRYADWKKKDPIPNIHEPLKNLLLDKFTLKSAGPSGKISRSMPPKLKDKLLAHALIIALHVEKFCLELASVQMDLKMPQTRIVTISYALGCHILTRKSIDGLQTKIIELKIPLFVMNEKVGRRTKKK